MRHIIVPLSCLSVLLLPYFAQAATLRGATTLDAPVVRVSDLWADAGPMAERVLGASPTPGNRIVIEAPQLAAIARQFGIDWRPASATDRVVLDRPGRPLPRETVFSAIQTALSLLGAPPDLDIDLPGFISPLVAQESEPQASVDQLDYDSASGRFTALLTVTAEGMSVERTRLSGRATAMLELPVLQRRLAAGTVIDPGEPKMTRVRADLVRGDVARLPDQMVGFAARRTIAPGQPVALVDLMRPSAITKGARVVIELQAPGLAVVAQGLALDNGAIGERIPVLNPSTHATLMAEVLGPGRVRVTPGSAPVSGTPVSTLPGALVAAR
jgi:flagella basal body P-ring formation protein FlgA